MTHQIPPPEECLRRGSVVWRGRSTWLVHDVTPVDVGAFPIRRPRPQRRSDVPLEVLADQLLSRIAGVPAVRLGHVTRLPRDEISYAGELSGVAMCRVSVALMRLYAAQQHEAKWTADREHRRRADAERCAL